MTIWRIVLQELRYRKLDTVLAVVAVLIAVTCLVAVVTLLQGHRLQLTEIAEANKEDTLTLMREVEDDYRKITTKLGYNVLVLHKDQDLSEFFAQGYATRHMPEDFVYRLAKSKAVTVRHLLPTLHRALSWPERDNAPVVLIGVRSEIPLAHLNPKAPLLQPVEKGAMRVGHVLSESLNISVGDEVVFKGKSFEIDQVHQPRGNTDDITIWIHLEEAQELLGREGEMNALMALSCHCEGASIDWLKEEFARLLPETQIIQLASQTDVRAQARDRASALTGETQEDLIAYHAQLEEERASLAAWLIPVVVLGAAIWVGLLALGNVRNRTAEIGIWRALGVRTRLIASVFLLKAIVLGLAGALLGYAAGFALGLCWGQSEGVVLDATRVSALFDPYLMTAVLVAAPLLTLVATWLPATAATLQDPAVVLRRD